MLRVIESVESKYNVFPLEEHTVDQIIDLLQKGKAQVLIDYSTNKRAVFIMTPRKQPGVRKIANLEQSKETTKTVNYGCD